MNIISDALEFVRIQFKDHDPSHDFDHVCRVLSNAKKILPEFPNCDQTLVLLGAIFHDMIDRKYVQNEIHGEGLLLHFFEKHQYSPNKVMDIFDLIKKVSFSYELEHPNENLSDEIKIVQDADRLDAIGAIGIARVFSYGAIKNRRFYDPKILPTVENLTVTKYHNTSFEQTTINHFYEKLLKLADMMKTETGKKEAQQRHLFMKQYLDQFHQEATSVQEMISKHSK